MTGLIIVIATIIFLAFIAFLTVHFGAPSCPEMEPGISETKSSTPILPEPVPEPSCLARGIARSIVEEPEKWEENLLEHTIYGIYDLDITHKELGTNLKIWRHSSPPPDLLSNLKLFPADRDFILDTIYSHPIGQMKTALERQAKQAAEQKAREDYFNRLGCPESPGKEKSKNPA